MGLPFRHSPLCRVPKRHPHTRRQSACSSPLGTTGFASSFGVRFFLIIALTQFGFAIPTGAQQFVELPQFQEQPKLKSATDSNDSNRFSSQAAGSFQDFFQINHPAVPQEIPSGPVARTANNTSPTSQGPKAEASQFQVDWSQLYQRPFEASPAMETSNAQTQVHQGSANPSPGYRNSTAQKSAEGYQPGWLDEFSKIARDAKQRPVRNITVDQLVMALLQYSPEIRALSQEPLIASTYIDVENARFDPIAYLESKWEDTNEPVGNILTTNNSPFLKDHVATGRAGIRRSTQIGTEIELFQKLGFKNSNSEFFQPQDQGTARLELNINQPLLNGAGRVVGTSRILLAEIDTDISQNLYAEQLQERILKVIRAYWELYYQKSVWVVRKSNLAAAEEILRQLNGRKSFDAKLSQIIRAEAAVAARKLDLVRSRTDVRNAETLIRELTRDPQLGKLGVTHSIELMPAEFPQINESIFPDLPAAVSVAFHNRPEINQVMARIKAAGIQNDVSKNQLLPQLNLILNTYTAALNGETEVFKAWERQFSDARPGYSAGFVLEYPIYNRAALARKRRIEAELTKLSAEMDDTLGSITAEVEIAFRELKMALEATAESQKSIEAAEKDEKFIRKRWVNFAFLENQDAGSPTIFLEQLLDAQDRMTQAQVQYANATRQFMVAFAELRKAEGSLLNYQNYRPDGLPGETHLDRTETRISPMTQHPQGIEELNSAPLVEPGQMSLPEIELGGAGNGGNNTGGNEMKSSRKRN